MKDQITLKENNYLVEETTTDILEVLKIVLDI